MKHRHMTRLRLWHEQRGSSVAQAAAVALLAVALIGAMLGLSTNLQGTVKTDVQCVISVISGGGSCATNGGTTTGGTATTAAPGQTNFQQGTTQAQPKQDNKSIWEKGWDWLTGQAKDLWDTVTDPGFLVGAATAIGVTLLILAAPIDIPVLAAVVLIGGTAALAGTLAGNAAHGQPLTDNLLRNTALGAGGGLLLLLGGEGIAAVVGGSMILNTINNKLTGQRWDKGLLASGLIALVFAGAGQKLLPKPEPGITDLPPVEEPVGRPITEAERISNWLREDPCLTSIPQVHLHGLAAPLHAGGCTAQPGSPEHRAQRWKDYQDRGGTWSYDRWSKQYDINMDQANKSNAAVKAYRDKIGWGETERVVVVDEEHGITRRLDIADVAAQKGIEHKTGYITYDEEIRSEVARDAMLVQQGWDIQWVFEGTASQPLLDALEKAGIHYIIIK